MHKVLRIISIIIAVAVALSCTKIDDIKVTSCGLESFKPHGFRSADAVLAIGIDNPAMAFKVSDLIGIVKYNGEPFAYYSAEELEVQKKSSKVYNLPCEAALAEGVSVTRLLPLLRGGSLEGYTTDIVANVSLKNGMGKQLTYKDLKLKDLLENKALKL